MTADGDIAGAAAYDYTVTGIDDSFRSILRMSQAGWSGGCAGSTARTAREG